MTRTSATELLMGVDLSAVSCGPTLMPEPTATSAPAGIIVVGKVSDDPTDKIRHQLGVV